MCALISYERAHKLMSALINLCALLYDAARSARKDPPYGRFDERGPVWPRG